MYKQSSGRSHRSKGIKVKHVLQICLLLAVCFWLIYQVKRSHEKRNEILSKDEKISGKVRTDDGILRFGRKDVPRVTEIATDVEKHSEDEEEKESEEEEENKHEEDEPEKEDSTIGDAGDEVVDRGGGDDVELEENENDKTEIEPEHEDEDENEKTEMEPEHEDEDRKTEMESEHEDETETETETEKTEVDPEHGEIEKDEDEHNHEEEEIVDEGNEKEENEGASEKNHTENEENDDIGKEDNSGGEENKDGGNKDHTGPEDNEYRRKDRNESDVALDDQEHEGVSRNTHEAREELYKADDASSEVAHDIQTGNMTAGSANQIYGKVNFGQENVTKTSDLEGEILQQREDEVKGNETSLNGTVTELKKLEINSTKSEDNPPQNSTLLLLSDEKAEHSTLLLSNGTQTASDANLSQNTTVEGISGDQKPDLSGDVSEHVTKSELTVDDKKQSETGGPNKNGDATTSGGESLISSNTSDSSHNTTGTDTLTRVEKSENSGTTGSDVSSNSDSSVANVSNEQHDPIDTSDTTLTQEEKESLVDLDTLPEIRTEVQKADDDMAE